MPGRGAVAGARVATAAARAEGPTARLGRDCDLRGVHLLRWVLGRKVLLLLLLLGVLLLRWLWVSGLPLLLLLLLLYRGSLA